MKKIKEFRTGFGFDSHLYSTSGTLMLGGRRFSGVPQLKGHSDGDALLHAVIDALLGAAVEGDIGQLYSDKDKSIAGISSRVMLRKVMGIVQAKKFKVMHVDVTVMADKPRMTPVANEIRGILAELLKVSAKNISLKAKTPEGLNFFKKPGGVAVWALATLHHV